MRIPCVTKEPLLSVTFYALVFFIDISMGGSPGDVSEEPVM